jgi:hypothetical protein
LTSSFTLKHKVLGCQIDLKNISEVSTDWRQSWTALVMSFLHIIREKPNPGSGKGSIVLADSMGRDL